MEDKYLNALYRIEEKSKHQLSMMSDKYNLLDELTRSMIYEEMITINDYLKLLEMFAIKYAEEEDRDAYEYTMIKMQMLVEAKRKKYKRTLFKGLIFKTGSTMAWRSFVGTQRLFKQKKRDAHEAVFVCIDLYLYRHAFAFGLCFHIPFCSRFYLAY